MFKQKVKKKSFLNSLFKIVILYDLIVSFK